MDIAQLGLEIRSDGVVVASDRLKKFGQDADRAERATDGLSRAFRVLGPLVGAVTAAFSVRALVQYADAWSDMQSRVGAAIKDMEAAPQMMRRMVDMANASYSPLEQTVEVYSRNVNTLRELGYAADGAADFTEALNHALVITATRGERAQSVQNALSKAMAVGKLQADGLETVLANGGRVAEALAAELGTTTSGLRGMASEGKITGDVIARALTERLQELRDEAAEMPATIGDAFVRINNNTTAFIGTLDKAWGVSSRVSESLLGMADGILASTDTFLRLGNVVGTVLGPAFDLLAGAIDTVAQYAGIATAALAGFYAPALVGGIASLTVAIGAGLVGAIRAVGVAMMANPISLFIASLAAGVTAAFMFRDEIKQAIGIDVVDVFQTGANTIIGAMVGAVAAIQAAWEVFPDFMEGLGIDAWNSFLKGFEGSAVTWTNPFTGEAHDLLNIDLSTFKKTPTPQQQSAVGAVLGAYRDAQGVDYVQQWGAALGAAWENAAGAGDAIADLSSGLGGAAAGIDAVGGAADAANGKVTKLLDQGLGNLTHWTKSFGDAAWGAFQNLGTGIVNAFKKGGDVASNVLDMLMDKVGQFGETLLNNGLNGLLSMGLNALGGMLGGGTWGVAGGFAGYPGIFGIPGMANGGTVARGGLSWVGERGPELLRLPAGAEVIPNGASMAMAANQNHPQRVQLDVSISVDENGNIVPLVRQVAGEEADVRVDYYDRKVAPRRINDLKNNSLVVNG